MYVTLPIAHSPSLFFSFIFTATPVADGRSQASGQIEAAAAATPDLSHICDL